MTAHHQTPTGGTHFRKAAIEHYLHHAAITPPFQPLFTAKTKYTDVDLEHLCAPVIHPDTGELITKYQKLQRDPVLKETWTTAFGKEFGSLAQGDNKTKAIGTDSLFVLDHDSI
jgi:hypothetical protein